jgi:ABC-type Fe3+-siderophore transport system permease subunit
MGVIRALYDGFEYTKFYFGRLTVLLLALFIGMSLLFSYMLYQATIDNNVMRGTILYNTYIPITNAAISVLVAMWFSSIALDSVKLTKHKNTDGSESYSLFNQSAKVVPYSEKK